MQVKEEGVIEPFKVYVRVRPFNEKELEAIEKVNSKKKIKSIVIPEDNLVFVMDPDLLELNV
jgi:hypothetical protein